MTMQIRTDRVKERVKGRQAKTILNLFSYKVPNIIIVGDKEIRRKVQNIEKNFNLILIFTEPSQLLETINKETIAIIVDEKKVKLKVKQYIEKLLANFKLLPIFYLSRSVRAPRFYTELYSKGLQGVINWPNEAKVLHNLIIGALKPHPKAIGRSKGDEKLSKIIKAHLVLNGSYKNIKVEVIEGFAFLEGRVQSLYDKKIIESEASKVLGVKEAITKNIKIRNSKKTTDKELDRKIKMYIGHLLGDKKRAISVKTKDKIVTLAGVATSHGDVLDIEEFVMKQAGVQNVVRLVKYHPSLVSKNVKKAKLLESKIKSLFEGVRHISINIYGEYAEVSGSVKLKADKSLVGRYLLQVLTVRKIVNKLFVA